MLKKLLIALAVAVVPARSYAVAADTTAGVKAPKEETRSYRRLARYLCDGMTTSEQKATAIYNWITHNIAYDAAALQRGDIKQETAEKTLKRRKGVCEGYTRLFNAMCTEVGITAVKVDGYAKDWSFDNGDLLYIPRHCWSAVLLDRKWQLVDVTWGAGGLGQRPGWLRQQLNKVSKNKVNYSNKLRFVFHYDPQFFAQDPATFRIRHLPVDPLWQLTYKAMPISVFEAGEQAIIAFNREQQPTTIANPYLDRLGEMSELERTYESADRAYEYNSRFHLAKASKNELHALHNMALVETDSNRDYSNMLYADAKDRFKTAEQLIKEQQKSIKGEYKVLRKKNKAKNAEAKQYIAALRNDNKRLNAQCDSRVRAADGKLKSIGTKYASQSAARRSVDPAKISSLKAPVVVKDLQAPDLLALQDMMDKRAEQIGTLHAGIDVLRDSITALKEANTQRLEQLAAYLQLADSALVNETIERIHMRDSYDDEVKNWMVVTRNSKYANGDTLHRRYLAGYSEVLAAYEALKRIQAEAITLEKSNLRALEQYRRMNNTNTEIVSRYQQAALACRQDYDAHLATLAAYAGYVRSNRKLFGDLKSVYKRQDKLVAYMEKAEGRRTEAEEKYFGKKEAFDLKENTAQQRNITRNAGKADDLYARITTGKKKKNARKA